jgi:hypothetical protein
MSGSNPFVSVQNASSGKFAQILEARRQKVESLRSLVQAQPVQIEPEDLSWSGRLGLDRDGIAGQAVNLGANIVSGGSRLIGDLASLPSDAIASAAETALDENHYNAYNRMVRGEATPRDIDLLNAPVNPNDPRGRTAMSYFDQSKQLRGISSKVDSFFNIGSIVDETKKQALQEDLREGFASPWAQVTQGWDEITNKKSISGAGDVLAGLGKLAYNAVGAAGSNPMAVVEYAAENAPQLLVGAAGKVGMGALTASNVGYGAEAYRKGLEKFQAENNGAFPDADTRTTMALAAAGTVALEQVGDVLSLKTLGIGAKAAKEAGDEIARKGLKAAILNTGKATAKGVATEAPTEAGQTYLEGVAGLKPASAEDIYVGGAIGGMTGGALTGGVTAVGEALSGVASKAADAVDSAAKREINKAAAEMAEQTGDVSVFLNKESPLYSPKQAVASLYATSFKEDATPEQRNENFVKALAAKQTMEAESDALYYQTPNGRKEAQAELAALPATPENEAKRAELEQILATPVAEGKELVELNKKRAALDTELNDVQKTLQTFSLDMVKAAEGIAQDADAIAALRTKAAASVDQNDQAAVQESQEAARVIINLSMSSPGSLSPEAALQLADDTSNGLAPAQRVALRQLSAAQVAMNKLKTGSKVRSEVLNGDPKSRQLGIADYTRRAGLALAGGNVDMALKQVAGLQKFLASHADKAVKAREALAQATELRNTQGNTMGVALVKLEQGGWEVQPIDPTRDLKEVEKELRDSGSLRIHPGSIGVVQDIRTEAQAIKASRDSIRAAVELAKAPATASAPSPATNGAPSAVTPAPAPSVPASAPVATTAAPVAPVASSAAPAEATLGAVQPAEVEQAQPAQTEVLAETATEETTDLEEGSADLAVEGKLPALQAAEQDRAALESSKVGAVFRGVNLVAAFFNQVAGRSKEVSGKPLASLQDFFSAWRQDNLLQWQYLPKAFKDKLRSYNAESVERIQALAALKNFGQVLSDKVRDGKVVRSGWLSNLRENMPNAEAYAQISKDFQHQDMSRYLVDPGTGKFSENVLTAVAYSAYRWTLDQANTPKAKLPLEILEMHGRAEGDVLTLEGRQALKHMAGFEEVVINTLGQAAVEALGLRAMKDAPQDLLPRLQAALGVHALALLERKGVLVRHEMNARQVAQDFFKDSEKQAERYGAETKFKYVQFSREGLAGSASAWLEIEDIKNTNRYSGSAVDKMFGVESLTRTALEKPAKFKQEFAKGTRQKIPAKLAKVLNRAQKVPHQVIPEMLDLMLGLGKQATLEAAGWVEPDGSKIHVERLGSIEAQNDNLSVQYEQMMEMLGLPETLREDLPAGVFGQIVQRAKDRQMFVEYEVWRNFRVGIKTQSLNMQSSKLHRFAFTRPNWKTKISFSNEALLTEFKISVAQALGVKTDKQTNAETMKTSGYQKIFNDPTSDVRRAAEVIRQGVLRKDMSVWTPENQKLVSQVAGGAEKMMSLQGLLALAQYLEAAETGADFEVNLLVGADGKTNGPVLTHLALGAAETVEGLYRVMNQGGMFALGNEEEHFSQYAEKGGQDLYQDLGNQVLKMIEESAGFDPQIWAAFQKITKPLREGADGVSGATRNLMKTPMTSFAFGSQLSKSVANMQNAFIEGIYTTIEDVAQGKRKDVADLTELIQALNTLIVVGGGKPLNESATAEQLLADNLFPQRRALEKAFYQIMGYAVEETMEAHFATFIERRRTLNKVIETGYRLYEAAYAAAREQMIQRLMESGDLAYREERKSPGRDKNGKALPAVPTGKRIPLHDLNQAQEQELWESLGPLRPAMNSVYTAEGNDLAAGIYMAKEDRGLSGDPIFQSTVQVGTPLVGRDSNKVATGAVRSTEAAPGAAGTPYSIHSLDSGNMHFADEMGADFQALNIHDEQAVSVENIAQASKNINQTTVENLLTYSPAAEARRMLERQVIALARMVRSGKLPVSAARAAYEQIAKQINGKKKKGAIPVEDAVSHMLAEAEMLALAADRIRLGTIAQMKTVDQYTWEGGQFVVTEKIRNAAQAMLEQLDSQPESMAPMAARYLEEVLYGREVPNAPAPVEVKLEAETDDTDNEVEMKSAKALGAEGVKLMTALEAPGVAPEVKEAAKKGTVEAVKTAVNALPTQQKAETIQALARNAAAQDPAKKNAWGDLGGSNPALQNEELVKLLSSRGRVSVRELLPVIRAQLQGSGSQEEGLVALLNRAVKAAGESVTVKYVTPDTPAGDVLEKAHLSNSRGWYVATNRGQREIYVLSPAFTHAAVGPEVLMHEIIHAALAEAIARPDTVEAKALVTELETLLQEVKTFLAANPELGFGNAALNVQELVAWGMTNRDFQTKVLAKIQVKEHKNKNNSLVSGMKSFIETVRRFFFKDTSVANKDKATNALTVLISDVAGLFKYVEQSTAKPAVAQNLSQQAPGNAHPAMRYTSEQIFDALPSTVSATGKTLNSGFQESLKGLLTAVSDKVHGPKGSWAANLQGTVAMTPHDVWVKAQLTGEAPFASKVLPALPGLVTEQEAFVIEQVEATMRASLDDIAQTGLLYRELSKLYVEARNTLKPSDFTDPDLHAFLFAVEQGADKRSDYITRFVAMGLGHQEVNQALQRATAVRQASTGPQSWADRLTYLFHKALALVTGKLTGTVAGENMNTRLGKLAGQLASMEAKKRARLARATGPSMFSSVSDTMNKGADALKTGALKVVESDLVKNSRFGVVQLAGTTAGIVLKEQANQVIDAMFALRDSALKERQGIAAGLMNSLRGPSELFQFLLRQLKDLEKRRQDIIGDVGKAVLKSYINEGENLTDGQRSAVTGVFLRSGMHVLLESTTVSGTPLDMAKLQELVESETEREAAVKARIGALASQPELAPYIHYYTYQAKALGYFKMTGRQVSAMGMMNAGNIARLYGTPKAKDIAPVDAAKAERLIDELASLYALEYADGVQMLWAKDVLRAEMSRGAEANGVEMTLRMHRRLENESKARLFSGSEALQMKGYTSEIYSPHVALVVARSPEEIAYFKESGYEEGPKLRKDPNDPAETEAQIFSLKDGGHMPYVTASLSLTGMAAKGSVRYGGMSNAFDEGVENTEQAGAITEARKQASMALFNPQPRFDPRMSKNRFMSPVLNERGEVVSWRYLMEEKVKDKLLQRNSRFDDVLGAMAGSIYDKENSVTHNREVIKALKQVYRDEYSKRPKSFVQISHDSEDPELREMYRLLPDSTQATIRSVWGDSGMFVPQDLLDVTFGYRKVSVTKPFDKRAAQRHAARLGLEMRDQDRMNKLEELFVSFTEGAFYTYAKSLRKMGDKEAQVFARTAGTRLRQVERGSQEIVREIKDTIVVRGIQTLVGNLKSNVSLLLIYGIMPWEQAHYARVAIKGATDYRVDRAELAQLRLKLESGYTRGDEDEIQARIAMLEDSLLRNPVRELIDAGLMPSIVEDVADDDDIYSYKAALETKLGTLTSKLNPKVREAGKWIYMTHDTPAYQALSRITQLSDFVGRYSIYMHLTTREKNPIDKAQAIQRASETFVNYDIPMHRGLQYLDDMGITMFTKYFLYIQRVLLKLGKERPAQVLMAAALHEYFGRMDLVTESSILYRFGLPAITPGPLGIVGAPAELPLVNATMSLLK